MGKNLKPGFYLRKKGETYMTESTWPNEFDQILVNMT